MQFFRPPLKDGEEHAEARKIVVEQNRITGGMAALAFVGVDGATVRFNTIERPGRWAIRILQETKAAGFVACRNGEFTDNVIIFESARWAEGGVNIGGGYGARYVQVCAELVVLCRSAGSQHSEAADPGDRRRLRKGSAERR
jgi:hypothetical protein